MSALCFCRCRPVTSIPYFERDYVADQCETESKKIREAGGDAKLNREDADAEAKAKAEEDRAAAAAAAGELGPAVIVCLAVLACSSMHTAAV